MRGAATSCKETSLHLFSLALEKYRESLRATSTDARTLRNTADVYVKLKQYNLAQLFYGMAVEENCDSVSCYKYADFLYFRGNLKLAEKYYRKSFTVEPSSIGRYLSFAKFLLHQKASF
jgi:tetratricopeptide (TPR) repeat protein